MYLHVLKLPNSELMTHIDTIHVLMLFIMRRAYYNLENVDVSILFQYLEIQALLDLHWKGKHCRRRETECRQTHANQLFVKICNIKRRGAG